MSHVRKEIRRVLNGMGFDNRFHICDKNLESYYKGGALVVTIQDWEPGPDAIMLKKKLECSIEGDVAVCFQMNGSGAGHAGYAL